MDNITEEVENKIEVLYNYLYGDACGKIVLYSNIILTSLFGPILMAGVVIFEMFAGDSQKRTIVNRLLSALLINLAFSAVLSGINRTIRDLVGLLGISTAQFLQLSCIFFNYAFLIFFNFLTIFRFLFIVVWKRFKGIQDRFWSYFLCFSSYTLSFWLVSVYAITGFNLNESLLIYLTDDLKNNITANNDSSTFSHR